MKKEVFFLYEKINKDMIIQTPDIKQDLKDLGVFLLTETQKIIEKKETKKNKLKVTFESNDSNKLKNEKKDSRKSDMEYDLNSKDNKSLFSGFTSNTGLTFTSSNESTRLSNDNSKNIQEKKNRESFSSSQGTSFFGGNISMKGMEKEKDKDALNKKADEVFFHNIRETKMETLVDLVMVSIFIFILRKKQKQMILITQRSLI